MEEVFEANEIKKKKLKIDREVLDSHFYLLTSKSKVSLAPSSTHNHFTPLNSQGFLSFHWLGSSNSAEFTRNLESPAASCHAEVAISGLVCHPSMRHPLFSSTLYPSPPAKRANNMLACLKAFDPRWTGSNPAESNRVLHWANVSCRSTRSAPSQATTLHICLPKYNSDITRSWLVGVTPDPSSESNKLE